MSVYIPESMQAILLQDKGEPLTVGQIPVLRLGRGQLLVRMAAAPINPSDQGFVKGGYGFQKPFSVVPGLEGSGAVAAAPPRSQHCRDEDKERWRGHYFVRAVSLACTCATRAAQVFTPSTV